MTTVSDATPDLASASSATGPSTQVSFMVSSTANDPDGQKQEKQQALINWEFEITKVSTNSGTGAVKEPTTGFTLAHKTAQGMSVTNTVTGALPAPGITTVSVLAKAHSQDKESDSSVASGTGKSIYLAFSNTTTTTGLDKGIDGCTVMVPRTGLTLTVTPASFVSKVAVTPSDKTALKLLGVTPDPKKGTIAFGVVGEMAPAHNSPTQYYLYAASGSGTDIDATKHLSVQIVYPYNLKHQSIAAKAADGSLNKVLFLGPSPDGTRFGFAATTIWYINTTIPILDEYGNPLDGLYDGKHVTETGGIAFEIPGTGIVSAGTYIDPVGPGTPIFKLDVDASDPAKVAAIKAAADQFKADKSKLNYDGPVGPNDANKTVQIDGISLINEIVNRTTSGSTVGGTNMVSVDWPPATPSSP